MNHRSPALEPPTELVRRPAPQRTPAVPPMVAVSRALHAIADARDEAELNRAIFEGVAGVIDAPDVILCEVTPGADGGPGRRAVLGGRGAFQGLDGLCTACDGRSPLASVIRDALMSGGEAEAPELAARAQMRPDAAAIALAWGPPKHIAPESAAALQLLLDQATLEQRRRRAVKAPRSMMVAGLAHDANNLLQVIHMAADTLREHTEGDAEAVELCGEIEDAAGRAAELIRELREVGGGKGAAARPDALRVIDDLQAPLRRLAGARQLTLPTRTAPAPTGLSVSQLERVIVNLVKNAVHHTRPDGHIRVSAEVFDELRPLSLRQGRSLPPGRYLAIRVADDGGGVPEALIDRIAEPFFTTRASTGGTGVGLAVVAGFAEACGGQLELDSIEGVGCSVSLYLPTDGAPEPRGSQVWRVASATAAWEAGPNLIDLTESDALRAALAPDRVTPGAVLLPSGAEALQRRLRALLPTAEVVLVDDHTEGGRARARALRQSLELERQAVE